MAKRTRYFNDPKFDEWLYTAITNFTPAQKDLLNDQELYSIGDPKAIRYFVNNAPQDRIDILLTKVGYRVARSYYAPGKLSAQVVKATNNEYNIKGKSINIMNEILRQDLFIVSDRSFIHSLDMMSMHSHSDFYQISLSYPTVRRAVNIMKEKQINSSTAPRRHRAMDDMRYMSRLLFQSISIESFLRCRYGLLLADLMILLLLYNHRHKWVSIDYLQRRAASKYYNVVIAGRASTLCEECQFVERRFSKSEKAMYTLTNKGILFILEVIRHIVKDELK